LVSGLSSIARIRLKHPTVVPISIGIANPIIQLVITPPGPQALKRLEEAVVGHP
jgi:hypothetical protein